jgi:hypothetical protein
MGRGAGGQHKSCMHHHLSFLASQRLLAACLAASTC